MSTITIEYDSEDLKIMIVDILAQRLITTILPGERRDLLRNAKGLATQRMADEIEKELRSA